MTGQMTLDRKNKYDEEISLKHKKVLVTGAGGGIGLSLCKKLHQQGAQVYALDLNQEPLNALAAECKGIVTLCVNLCDWDATKKALEPLPVLDGLVNNAGIGIEANFLSMKEDQFDKVVGVNLKGLLAVSQVVAKKMIDAGKGGSIVNISSLASRFGTRVSLPYNLTKTGVDMMTKSFALEWGPHNIRSNSVNPSFVVTSLSEQWAATAAGKSVQEKITARTPLGRVGKVEEVVNLIIFLLSDAAPMIHGESIFVDGGYSAF